MQNSGVIGGSGRRHLMAAIGVMAALVTYCGLRTAGLAHPAAATAAVTVLCLIWWVSEPVPVPVTSLLPMAAFPLLGVLDGKAVAAAYGSPLILLLLGGFLLSRAMEYSGAHRRVALYMVRLVGSDSPRRVVFGFMLAAAALSMWISNTATTLMLLPVAMAVLERNEESDFAPALLLGVAYAASIGGIGTPIGTPPNLVFMQVYRQHGGSVDFTEWMSWGVPVVALMIPAAAWWLTRHLPASGRFELPDPGRWRPAEVRVLAVFVLTALAWMTRKEPFGGWSAWFGAPNANDAAVAFVAVVALFLIPDGTGRRLLDWETAVRIPWGVLLLFAGGITIASAFEASGLSTTLAQAVSGVGTLPVLVMIGLIALAVTFITETTSNTASTALLMPVLAAAAAGAGVEPALLMVPATMSASCAFMLPVATAPNSIVYGSGQVTTRRMAATGFALNLIGAVVITAVCYWRLG